MEKWVSSNCWKRAWRTFFQTTIGVLGAGLVAFATDMANQVPNWQAGGIVLLASSISAGIAAAMNRKEECDETGD